MEKNQLRKILNKLTLNYNQEFDNQYKRKKHIEKSLSLISSSLLKELPNIKTHRGCVGDIEDDDDFSRGYNQARQEDIEIIKEWSE